HISHLKTAGEMNWGKIDRVFEKISDAHQKGVRLTCDRYPYTAGSTGLDAILPSWAYDGGPEEELKRLRNERERLASDILKAFPDETGWKNVVISSVNSDRNRWMQGKSLFEISRLQDKTRLECLFGLLIDEKLRVDAIFFSMNEDNLRSILRQPYTMIGSDSSARSFDGITARGKPHPRGFGTFPRVLGRYVREQALLSLEEAVYRMTGLTAETFGIKNRGVIKEGYFADITVFDADKVIDVADYDDPFKKPEGIHYVFVNGGPALWEGSLTGALNGRILKNQHINP
ncbi:MAG TPA: D-aminoacylase, partial [Nitrospirae bacterium]|nr:D-aminoacylase [Nitrospirota bacterium]